MNDLKEKASNLWTKLLQALRDDGLIANCVLQSGPATTSVIVELVQLTDPSWLRVEMKPAEDKWVIARTSEHDRFVAVTFFPKTGRWMDANGRTYTDNAFVEWRFVS